MKKIFLLFFIVLGIGLSANDISPYLYGDLQTPDTVKKTLASNGLETIGEYNAMGDPNYHVIVYTSKEMKDMASKKGRGFAGVQKVLIDKKDNRLIFTNPNYFIRAFMQKDLDGLMLAITKNRLSNIYKDLKKSPQRVHKDKLASYHFMFGMPYYEDMITVAEGQDLDKTLEKNAKGKIVFKLPLKNSILYGVYMDTKDGEKTYVSKINQQKNCAFLPYMVLIEDNKAKILNAKYYLAISLPDLSLGQFMTISSTPGNIEDFFKSLFK